MKTLFAIGFLLFICWMYFVSRRSKTELAELVGSGFVVTAMDSVPEQQIAFDGINKKIAFLGVRVPYPDSSNPISYYRVSLIVNYSEITRVSIHLRGASAHSDFYYQPNHPQAGAKIVSFMGNRGVLPKIVASELSGKEISIREKD